MKKQLFGHDVEDLIVLALVGMTALGGILMVLGIGVSQYQWGRTLGFIGMYMLVFGFLGAMCMIAIESGR